MNFGDYSDDDSEYAFAIVDGTKEPLKTAGCFTAKVAVEDVAFEADIRELKMETFSGRRQLQPDVTS